MKLSRRTMISLTAAWAAGARVARSAERWVEGTHYFRIDPPQPPPAASRAVITEVFSYCCSACNMFQPFMHDLEKRLPGGVALDYLPASWNPAQNWPLMQRAWFAAKALGVHRRAHDALFAAIWESGELSSIDVFTGRALRKLPGIEDVARFYERATATPAAKFIETAGSPAVEAEMKRADELIKALRVESTPTLVVNGRYRIEPRHAGSGVLAVELALWLAQGGPRP